MSENVTGLLCCDCGGWPIDGGAYFLAVLLVHQGKPLSSQICELCWLKRLSRRGGLVNMTSSAGSQITVPDLDLWREGDRPRMEQLSQDLIDALLALQVATGKGWMNETMYRRGEAFLQRFVGGIPSNYKDGLTVESA